MANEAEQVQADAEREAEDRELRRIRAFERLADQAARACDERESMNAWRRRTFWVALGLGAIAGVVGFVVYVMMGAG